MAKSNLKAARRRTYKPELAQKWASVRQLPFVGATSGLVRHWIIPKNLSYSEAVELGAYYAAHYAQFLHDNPGFPNLLGVIARDVDFADATQSACWFGFSDAIEESHVVATQREGVDAHWDLAEAIQHRGGQIRAFMETFPQAA